MPPTRNLTAAKPVKTERTHEENQERAYIAASRRSDRSLEARIESARRASEIHKKRTGRALRVTEQDVMNEEMYEEEDDDIHAQYSRLSSYYYQTSLNFNRKLSSYLASNIGVRDRLMVEQDPSLANLGSPFLPHAFQFPQPTQPFMSNQMLPPQMYHQYPQTYRHSPYLVPHRSQGHQRSASIPTPQHMQSFQATQQHVGPTVDTPKVEEQRRMSLPAQLFESPSPRSPDGQMRPPLSRSSTDHSIQQPTSPQHGQVMSSTSPPTTHGTPGSQSETTMQASYSFMPQGSAPSSQALNIGPFSVSLPPESQQLVGSALNPNDPRTQVYMAGSNVIAQPFSYSYNPNPSSKSQRMSNSPGLGMSQTLAPGVHVDAESEETPIIGLSSADPENLTSLFVANPGVFGFGGYNDTFQFTDTIQSGSNQDDEFNPDNWLDENQWENSS
ncbi:hypothetical protein K469DRAFT_685998 [Zopfia rhizophila CBS 207.26]|uniref:Uncharacterized protein n=1 Tax=Zopfia rhizophila CBS 207.26 TaxID=1314779 RepID=A0A6A6D5P2_9PEZI|nr:hypothetical protein K469DRAFT_685998 [Zopfia rhizophila CBS 207.26]